MSEYEIEPVPGLPGLLPADERILWQGAPDRRLLARGAFHQRKVALYFGALVLAGASAGASATGIALTVLAAAAALGLIELLAWGTARATLYTLTTKRVVLRYGIAIPKCVNLPLAKIAAADLKPLGGAAGEIALRLTDRSPFGYALLWPHARPFRFARPEPMLRGLTDASDVARQLAQACGGRPAVAQSEPSFTGALAA